MGGDAVANSWYFWSCVRYYGTSAWVASGGYGFLAANGMYGGGRSLPVSLYRLPEAIL